MPTFSATGGVETSGAAPCYITGRNYRPTGSVTLGSEDAPSIVNFKFYKSLEFKWNSRGKIVKDIGFFWGTGEQPSYWYRIVTKGKDGDKCPPIQGDPCCQKMIFNLQARSLSEICQKIADRGLNVKIDTIHRFSRPAETSYVRTLESQGVDLSCNVMEEIDRNEVKNIPDCLDYFVNVEGSVTAGITVTASLNASKTVEAEGSVYVYGTSPASYEGILISFSATASGGVETSGEAVNETDSYTGRGGVVLGGSARLAATNWEYVGGEWPDSTGVALADESTSEEVSSSDVAWALTERILSDDGLYSSADISFGKTTQRLIARGFGISIPEGRTLTGLKVTVDRLATKAGVRDLEVYLISGNDIISDNLADTASDWPLIETTKVYGSNGVDGGQAWRDPNSEYYEDDLTVEDVISDDFGVMIRVNATTSLAATIVRVDYISVEAFFEDPDGSIIRIGSDVFAGVSSPAYSYFSSGRIRISGEIPTIILGLRHVSNGLNSAANPAITISGNSVLASFHEGSGGAVISGEANVGPILEVGSGGAIVSGEAEVKPFYEVITGGAIVSGVALVQSHLYYSASGEVEIGGTSITPEIKFSYTATGSVVIDGVAGIRLEEWTYESTERDVYIEGSSICVCSDKGTLEVFSGIVVTASELTVLFLNDVHVGDAEVENAPISFRCGCSDIPLEMQLSHNLYRSNILLQFLRRNGFSTSNNLRLKYNSPNDSWQDNLHYRGMSADGNNQESWDITFELQCTSSIGGVEVGKNIWKLSLFFFKKNLTTGEDFESRVLVAVMPDNICTSETSPFDFEVTYDTAQKVAVVDPVGTIYLHVLHDNIGIFKSRVWVEDPDLRLRVSTSVAASPVTRVDLTDAVFVN